MTRITQSAKQSEGVVYRFDPVKLKTWLEKQAASGDKDTRQNDSTTKGGQKGK